MSEYATFLGRPTTIRDLEDGDGDGDVPPITLALFGELPFNKLVPVGGNKLETFTCFPDLPLELRLAIWKLTFPPRTIKLTYTPYTGFHPQTPPPKSYTTNQESYTLFKSLYTLSFGSRIHKASTHFNFALDTLYLPEQAHLFIPHLFGIMTDSEINQLRYLAIDHRALMAELAVKQVKCALREMKGLERLDVVYELPGVGRSRSCNASDCLGFRGHLPFEVIGWKGIQGLVKLFQEREWGGLDPRVGETVDGDVSPMGGTDGEIKKSVPESESRCGSVYGWRECHCWDVDSNSDWEESDGWTDEDDDVDGDEWDAYADYGEHEGYDDYGMGMLTYGRFGALMGADDLLSAISVEDEDRDEDEYMNFY